MLKSAEVQNALRKLANKKRAEVSRWFFKTGKGEYGEGDLFIGIPNPILRKVALSSIEIQLSEVKKLLRSNIHEDRFVALEILVAKFERSVKEKDQKTQDKIASFFLQHKQYVNNWDLVDTSASYILGEYLFRKKRKVLGDLARSKSLWDRRIAIISTHYFIKQKDFKDTFAIAKILLNDKEDLIHKAVGWMLREVGKQDENALKEFLLQYVKKMPRTTLRYAIERFSKKDRDFFMKLT